MNITQRYKENAAVTPVNIRDITVGMNVLVGERLEGYTNHIGKIKRGLIGTVESTKKCHWCDHHMNKVCYNQLLSVKIINTNVTVTSCFYKLYSIQGNPIVSEREYRRIHESD